MVDSRIMRPLYNDEVLELEALLDVIEHPEKYGCRFDRGDPKTYQERAGNTVDQAAATIRSLRDRVSHPANMIANAGL